jgi:hypothetical protein
MGIIWTYEHPGEDGGTWYVAAYPLGATRYYRTPTAREDATSAYKRAIGGDRRNVQGDRVMTFAQRVERETEGDRLRAVLRDEGIRSGDRVRAAFHTAARGLMDWRDPSELTGREYRRLEGITGNGNVYRPYDPQGDVEPYDLDRDDYECERGER